MNVPTQTRFVTAHLLRLRQHLSATAALACAAFVFGAGHANAQLTLPDGTSYTQDFDSINTALPAGWSVRTGANSTSLGTAVTFSATKIDWANTSGAFKNFASADGSTSTDASATQSAKTDRALGVRQTGPFGDPGVAFTLQVANTLGKTGFNLAFKHQILSHQTRSTVFTVQYSLNGTSWSDLGTFTDPGAFGSTDASYSFGSAIDNQPGSVYIRVAALSGSTGSGSRDSYALDDLQLTWTNAEVDSTPPVIASVSPVDDSTGVEVTTGLSLEFDENVFKGTGNLTVVDTSTGTAFWTIPVSDASVVVSGTTVTVNLPTTPNVLDGFTAYHINIDAGAFTDAAGNGFAGISDSTTWNFTTSSSDTTSPSVTSLTPSSSQTAVLPGTSLSLTFDETIQLGVGGSIEIRKASDDTLVQSIAVPSSQVIISGSGVSINPSGSLEYGTTYRVVISSGIFTDLSGNPAAAISGDDWTFTTRDAPPVIISQYYEGLSNDRYIELKNTTGADLPLDGYAVACWANADRELWKTGTGATTRIDYLDGFVIPANGHFLIANPGAVAPAYAASNYDYQVVGGATFISGDDSIVLYFGTGFSQSVIEDAVSFTANQGADKSFYRLSDTLPGFDLDTGSSILNYPSIWAEQTLANVAAAASNDLWYLRATTLVQDLGLTLTTNTVAESAGAAAITATVTRTGSTADDLFVIIESTDLFSSVLFPGYEVTIPAGSDSATFTIDAIDNLYLDGEKSVTITVSAVGFVPASQTITVTDDANDLPYPIVINEVNSTPSTDEFVELYNDSDNEVPLDGLLLVFYNGNGDVSYYAKDLSGYTIPARGYFVVGNAAVPNVDIGELAAGFLQDGADAVALIVGRASNFPNGSPVATINGTLLDALVYDTADPDDAGLLAALTPDGIQVDENATSSSATVSISRIPDGGAAFDTLAYVLAAPTPGTTNDPTPEVLSLTPTAGSIDVPLNANLTITFSEPVISGSGLISVYTAAGEPVAVLTSDDLAVSINGATVTVDLPGLLDYATSYYVNVSAGAFIDLTGNASLGIEDETTWTFTTTAQDLIAPSVTAYTPLTASTGVSPTADLLIEFDENIFTGTGTITIHAVDGAFVETIDVASAQVSVSGSLVTINPSVVLEYGSTYYVNYGEGVFVDGGNNTAPAVADDATWSFTTLAAPSVVISQYYEGLTTADRYIELRNLTSEPLSLAGYRLATWNEEPATIGGREGWKAGNSTTTRVMSLDSVTIPANGHWLIATTGATVPAYAAANFDGQFDVAALVSEFSGDDSVVLYQGAGFTRDEVVDAVSFSAVQGSNKSFVRIADSLRGFDFAAGSSILNYSGVWQEVTLADVAAATFGADNYLTASVPPKVLTLELSVGTVLESAGAGAVTATVTRGGSLTDELVVNVAISDPSEASAPSQVTIPAGEAAATFAIDILNDAFLDGDQSVSITLSAANYVPGSATLIVQDDGDTAAFPVVINEVEADAPGTDTTEFIELYNTSADPVSLGGVVMVLFNGSNDTVYSVIDLSAHTIPANGFFVIGSTGMASAQIQLAPGSGGWLQNGQDAVALYFGSPANFTLNTTLVSEVTNTLIDALVYDTNDADDIDLLSALTPDGVQIDEAGAGNAGAHVIARVPDGGAAFDTASYVLQAPTPGTTNQIAPVIRTQPAASTIDSGNTASVNVAALGGQLSYQWYQGNAGVTTTPVGTNSSSLTTPTLNATTSFWVRVSNPYGSADSNAVLITVNAVAQPPLITTQPASTTIDSGTSTVLTVGADGQGQSLSFAWYQGTSGDTSVPVGTNAASFTTPSLTETTSYWVRVTSAGGSVDSSTATVTVQTTVPPASIASFTASPTTIDAGGSSTLSWSVTGAASLSIDNGVGDVTGSSSVSVSPAATTTYTLTATNAANASVTASATVTVNAPTQDHPAFKVTSVNVAGTTVTLDWESQTGASYTVEVTEDPADPQSWAPLLSNVASQGASTSASADLGNTAYAGSSKLFFRVKTGSP